MASPKTYPVSDWVRAVVCLAPFAIAGIMAVMCLKTGRGMFILGSALTLCGIIARQALTKK
jgi:hypothetical protein